MNKIFVSATPNELVNTASPKGNVAGFWQGLWHGFTLPFTFFISLFNPKVGLYESHNNGGWYNFGFFLGLMMILGGNKGVKMDFNQKK